MNYRVISTALSVAFVAVLGSAFYMVRAPEPDPPPASARARAATEASAETPGWSVRETVAERREGRRRLSRDTDRMLETMETETELRRRGSRSGASWSADGKGWDP
jgi:hypothetical protein